MTTEYFDLEKIESAFTGSLKDDDDVLIDEYIEGYKQISTFFHLMGTIFSFVSSDVTSKIEILKEFRSGEQKDKFISIKTMLNYEKDNDLLEKKQYVSGSRTLLRLHRGLEFIRAFLEKLPSLGSCDKTSTVCQQAYNDTLAKYHPWLVRKGANVAMLAMPTRDVLLKKVCTDIEKATKDLPRMLEMSKIVYDRTEELYTKYNLHSLP